MITFLRVLFVFALVHTCFMSIAQHVAVKKDLQSEWLVYEDGKFIPYEDRSAKPSAVYFNIDKKTYKGDDLFLESVEPFTLFVNNTLAVQATRVRLDIDSLTKAYATSQLLVGVYQKGIRPGSTTTTVLQTRNNADVEVALERRNSDAFRDFTILAGLLLIVMAVIIVRLNPKLATDYFSLPKMFSTRELEDSQIYLRIGSSTNILFYAYCSLLLGFYLIILFHFLGGVYPIASDFSSTTFAGSFGQWLKLSGFLLIFLFVKIILVFAVSYIFGVSEIAGIHFFNWVRLLLVIFGALTVILFIYFIWHGQSEFTHAFFLKLLAWIIGGWMILILLKLSSKASASLFHLFSYICATELIPFLFIIKVLYN